MPAGLTLFRLGRHDRWVRWFADAVSGAGRSQLALINEVEALRRRWRDQLGRREGRALRRDAVAWRALELLPRHLVLTSAVLSAKLGVTGKGAHSALRQMAEAGIVLRCGTTEPSGEGRPSDLYVCPELLALVGSNPLR